MTKINDTKKLSINQKIDIYSRIASPQEAFVISRMTTGWTTAQNIFHGCGSLTQEEFTDIINTLLSKNVLLEKSNPEIHEKTPPTPVEIIIPVKRHYPHMEISEFSFSESLKNVPKTAIKEVVFLSRYGKNIDFYRRLGFQKEPFEKTPTMLKKRIETYHQFYNQIKQVSNKNIQFTEHLERSAKNITATEILLTPAKREKYDKKLIEQGIYTSKKEIEKKENSRIHYDEAIKLIDEGKLQQARNAIQIALQIEPENSEYIATKERITHINKQNAVKILLLRLEKNETLMWDERILQKTLAQLFEINNYISTRIKVAKILVEKKAFAVALEVLREASPTDKDTRNKVTALQKEIKKRYKAYKAQF